MATKQQHKQARVCLSVLSEISLYGLCIFLDSFSYLPGDLPSCKTNVITRTAHEKRGVCVHVNIMHEHKGIWRWYPTEYMSGNGVMYPILILNVRSLSCPSTEPERWRCSTPHVQRTGSSMLWTGVWTGWDKAPQQHTTGTVGLRGLQ